MLDMNNAITAQELERHCRCEHGGEHPELTRADWRDAVDTRDTLAGYWDWVASVLARKLVPDWEEGR